MNQQWNFSNTEFNGLYLINPFCSFDSRGYFLKDYSEEIFLKNGISYTLKETFYSFSQKGVIRGLHFQRVKQMPKLVRCINGSILDAVCDLRKDSPTFKKWKTYILSGDNMTGLLIPGGFAHGFMALEDSLVSYKCGECFAQEFDDGIIWNDPDIGIDWNPEAQIGIRNPIISDKDSHLQTFKEFLDKYGGLE